MLVDLTIETIFCVGLLILLKLLQKLFKEMSWSKFLSLNLKISKCTIFSKHNIKIDLKDEFFPIKNELGKNKIIFSTNYGRELEYYTGMVFNIKDHSSANLIQGGRYDNLLSNLGSKRKIPAVGAAINLNSYDN